MDISQYKHLYNYKKKDELIEMFNTISIYNQYNIQKLTKEEISCMIVIIENIIKNTKNELMRELLIGQYIESKIYKKSDICNYCRIHGHIKLLKYRCPEYNIIKNKIYYICQYKNVFTNNSIKLYQYLSNLFGLSETIVKNIIKDINIYNFKIDIDRFIIDNQHKCSYCLCNIYTTQHFSLRKWKNNILCDNCWSTYHSNDINELWNIIRNYKPKICYICGIDGSKNDNIRFHYDHINMFNKYGSIWGMVDNGKDIVNIKKELDKCNCVCIHCHSIITSIEGIYGFTNNKKKLTIQLKKEELTKDEYDEEYSKLYNIYNNTMKNVYNDLREAMNNNNSI